MRFSNLKVGLRIYLGFGVLVALSIAVAGFGIYQFSAVGEQNALMARVTGNVRRVLTASHLIETVRRAETRYRIDAKPETLKVREDSEAEARRLLTDASAAAVSEERRQIFNATVENLRQHNETFGRYLQAANAATEARAKLFAGGDELTANAAKLVAAARAVKNPTVSDAAATVESAVLLVRIANWRFIGTNDPKGPATFATNVEKARAAIAAIEPIASPEIKPLIAPVVASLDAYAAAFATYSVSMLKSLAVFETEMLPQLVEMQNRLATAEASLGTAFETSRQANSDIIAHASLMQQFLCAVVLVLGAAFAILIGRGIARPVTAMTAAMAKLAAGDKTIEIPARGQRDEIGDMARAVEVFLRQAIENDRLAAERAQEQAAKERRQQAMDGHTRDFGSSVSGVMASFMASAATMRKASADVSESVRRTRASTSSTVQGAEASARDLNSVAAAAEQMAASIREISNQVAHVSSTVQVAVDRAAETDAKVAGLSETADRIGDVVRLINDVAGQTNLLALNATIEAARAGEAGRGFAVVAGEVKALAAQTARATEQIGTQIVLIRSATKDAVTAVRDVGSAIGNVVRVASAIAAAVEEQAAATQEISNNVQSVTATTSAASEEMRAVLAIAEATDSTSDVALAAAEEVARTADTLRSEVTEFLAAMSRGGDEERRLYERISGNGALATLKAAGRAPERAVIANISRGGMAVRHGSDDAAGTDLEIGLPSGDTVRGRVARRGEGLIAIAFRQDEASLRAIDRTLELIARGALKPAA